MVFSQTGTAFAAENAAAADTAVEAAAEEEPETETAVVEEPEEPEEEKEPEVAPSEGAENEDPSADEIQDEVTTDDEEPGDTIVDEPEETAAEEESVEEADEGITEEAPAETDETVEEPEEEVAAKESKKDEDYFIEIRNWESEGPLFEDGEWSCPIEVDGFDGVQYNLQASVSDHNGPENADTEDVCRIEGEPGNEQLIIDGRRLKDAGIDWVRVRVEGFVEGESVAQCERDFDVRKVREDYDREWDRTMIPGWDGVISGSYGVHVENSEHPDGYDTEYSVTDVRVVSDEAWGDGDDEVIVDFHRDQKSDDDYWWYYRVGHPGEATLEVTYEDIHGETQSYEFTLHVRGDVYTVSLSSDGRMSAFPGGEIELNATGTHEYLDENGDYHRTSDGVDFDWFIEDGEEIAQIDVDQNDHSRATLRFNTNGDNGQNQLIWLGLRVLDEDGNETEAYCRTGFWRSSDYIDVYPMELPRDLEVGESLENIEYEVRHYVYGVDGYDVINDPDLEFSWNYDENAISITENRNGQAVEIGNGQTGTGNTFTVTRKREWSTHYEVHVRVNGEDHWNNYLLENLDYNIWFEQHDLDLYSDDPEVPSLELHTDSLGDNWQDRLDLKIQAGHWDRDHWGEMLEEGDYTVDVEGETVRVALSNAYLQSLDDYEDIRVTAEIYAGNAEQTDDNRIRETDAWFHIRQAKEEYDREWDRTMLPGWDGQVNGSYRVHIENSENPDGRDEDYSVTNVEVISDDPAPGEKGDVVVEFRHEQNDDDHWWYYRVGHRGEATLRVTYEDIHGQTQSYEFKLYVGDDVYNVWIESEGNKGNALPGDEIRLFARGNHEYRDENGDQHGDDEGLGYVWDFEYGNEYADLEVSADPSVAVLRFKDLPDGWDDINENVRVCVRVLDEEGHETEGYDSREFWVHTDYTEVWPLEIDKGLDVGASIENIPFEVRRYTFGDDEYEVIDDLYDVTYEWHFDQNALSITEMRDGNPVEIGDGDTSGSPVTITRKGNWHTDFNVCAKWHENGEYRDTWGNYYFDDKNYDFWYEIDGNDTIYSDGLREFGFNLDNLEGVDFELVPEVGAGRWNEESGFEHPITQDQGWSYDADKHTITFSGEMLYDQGIDRLETRISLRIGGVEVADEWRGFDVREARFDFHGEFDDAVLFVDDEWYVSKNGNVYLETTLLPDGAEGEYTIREIQYESGQDEFDTRDAVDVIEEENGWLFKAVRGGEVNVHVNLQAWGSGNGVDAAYTKDYDFRIIVGGRRINMGLETETGSDRLQPGGSIRVFPQIYAEEYDWNTGDRYGIDTSDYQVRYEVRCNRIDQRIIDEQFDGDFDRATERGEFWDYAEDPESRSIILFTEENADNMELEIEAYLIDPDSGEECARADRRVFVNSLIYAVEFYEEGGAEPYTWDKELPPGAEVTLVPRLMKKEGDGEFEPVEDTDVTYRMGWYSGNENDQERDPAHIIVSDGGRELQPNDEISGPVKIKRNVAWNFNFNVEAEWEGEDGWMQGVGKSFVCNEVNYSDGFIVNNNRGDEWSTWYYDDEMISIKPDRDKLDALAAEYPVETTVEMGICIDRENNTIIPIQNYVIDDEGVAQYSNGEYDISQIFSENGGLTVNGENLINLQRILRYQNKPQGDRWPVLDLRIHSELNGVKLIDHVMSVDILSEIRWINEFRDQMGVGTEQIWENGRASLYVEDSDHDNGQDFDITITNITIQNEEDDQYLDITNNGGTWRLYAKKESDHDIPLSFTYSGGPTGSGQCNAAVKVTGILFEAELRDETGKGVDNLDMFPNDQFKMISYVECIHYQNADQQEESTVTETRTVLSRQPNNEGYYYEINYDYDDNRNFVVINKDTGIDTDTITANKLGSTTVGVEIRVMQKVNDEEQKQVDYFHYRIPVRISASRAVLTLPEDATFNTIQGLTYTAEEIGQKIGGTLTVYSMKNHDGSEYPISDYSLEEVIGGDGKLTLTGGDGWDHEILKVAADAPVSENTLILAAREAYGNRGSSGIKVKVQEATIDSNWANEKIAKTKHKDVKITFSNDDANGDSIVSYKSSNNNIVTAKVIDEPKEDPNLAGKLVQTIRVTAGTKAGTGKITVKLKSGKSIVLTVTVPKVNCTGITAKSSYTVTTLSTIDMGVKLNPVYSDNTITYKSANTKIATVTSKGVVKGIKVGTTTITITTNNKKKKTVKIVVKQGTTGLTTAKTAYTVVVGKTVSIGAKKKPTNSADPITYTSANTKIATVTSKGVIKGIKAGKTTITVKSGTKTKKVTVTVKPKTTGITTLKTAYTVKVKKTVSLGAKVVPATSGEPLTYTSSNAKIATVSKTGVVTGVKKGKVTITIKSGAVTKKVTVTVN